MVQMWEVVPESSNQLYLVISWEWLNGEAMYAQSLRFVFTSSAAWFALFPFLDPFLPFGPCPSFPPPFAQQSPLTCPFFLQWKHSLSLFGCCPQIFLWILHGVPFLRISHHGLFVDGPLPKLPPLARVL